jgi:hypothetical protein
MFGCRDRAFLMEKRQNNKRSKSFVAIRILSSCIGLQCYNSLWGEALYKQLNLLASYNSTVKSSLNLEV